MPTSVELPYALERDKRTGEVTKADYRKIAMLYSAELQNDFVQVVSNDVVRQGKIWGLPLSVDTLALFYNRTLFDNAGLTRVPSTWLEVKEAVKRLTLQNEEGEIVQSGIALGGAENINRSNDILALLMMQNGTQIVSADGRSISFNKASPYASDEEYRPGVEALRFYTDFARPSKEVYTWNKNMPEATEAFTQGKLAMMLGYAYQLPLIRAQGAKVNLGVAKVPHINSDGTDGLGRQVNFASYWVETVAKMSEYKNYAWDFLKFATSQEQVGKYLEKTSRPTALRALVNEQKNNLAIKPFAEQILTAKSWYQGRQPIVVEEIFNQMVKSVVNGSTTPLESIEFAAKRVGQTL